MKLVLVCALLLAVASPVPAQEEASEAPDEKPDRHIVDEDPIFDAVDAFLAAIGSDDKTDLADHMLPDGTIFVHNLLDAKNPRVDVVSNAKHLENWAKRGGTFEEAMDEYELSVSWTMAHAWGWYTSKVDGKVSHCGVNSLSLVRMADATWKVGNASFTMVPPDECERQASTRAFVDEVPEDAVRAARAAAEGKLDGVRSRKTDRFERDALLARFEADPPQLAPDRLPEGYKLGRCLLEVDGEVRISGPCAFIRNADGGFMFNGPRQVYEGVDFAGIDFPMGISTDYFAYVMHYENDIDEATGQGWYASWNEDKRSTHADAYLGAVKRDGACYSNARTRICVWES